MERKVKFSGQELTVKPLTWEAWKSVKKAIAKAMAGEALPEMLGAVMELFQGVEDGATKAELVGKMSDSPAIRKAVTLAGPAAIEFVDSIDGLTELIIEETTGCNPEDVPATEVIELRNIALEVADLPGLFAAEKNSLAAVWTRMAAKNKSNGNETPSNSVGTPSSSLN